MSASETGTRSPVAPTRTTQRTFAGSPSRLATQAESDGSSSDRGDEPHFGTGLAAGGSATIRRWVTLAPVTGVSSPLRRGGGTAPVAMASRVADARSLLP